MIECSNTVEPCFGIAIAVIATTAPSPSQEVLTLSEAALSPSVEAATQEVITSEIRLLLEASSSSFAFFKSIPDLILANSNFDLDHSS